MNQEEATAKARWTTEMEMLQPVGIPAEGIEARMQRLDKENRALERNLAAEREEKQQTIGYLLAFHDALRGIVGDESLQPAISTAIQRVPGLASFVGKQKEIKSTRDKDLRQRALSRMSRDEACSLGVLEQWQRVNAVHELMQADPTEQHRYGR